jgi:hypothetical protein
MKIDLVSLDECPEGLFLFNGTLCFKSEYHTQSQVTGYSQCDAYVVSSGEYFWGGASTAKERGALLVEPVAADIIDALTKENERLRELLADMDRTIEWGAACPAFGHQFQERIEAALQEQDDG